MLNRWSAARQQNTPSESHQGEFDKLELHGRSPAPGMDPAWLLQLASPHLDAEVIVFPGPYVEVAACDLTQPV